jgi:hypothetical protein
MLSINFMLFKKVQQGLDEDLIKKIKMKLIFTLIIFLYLCCPLCYKNLLLP